MTVGTDDQRSPKTHPPETPPGYAPPTRFEYPLSVLFVLAAVLVVLGVPAFGSVLWVAQGSAVFEAVFLVEQDALGFTFALRSGLVAGIAVGSVLLTVVVHELVHGAVYRYYGYDVRYGVVPHLGAAYACAFGQFQRRDEVLVVTAAPLAVLTPCLLALFFVPVPLVAFAAFVAVLFNTAGAAGDIYAVVTLLRRPRGTVLYDADVRHSYVFEPER
ncbi:DUF3267 domain-containing protein [Halogeometricum limi]|uniref:Zincin peptidase n=1 Tax=Halogeometricum limi TaxID=555875 RepID=A0A1I6HIP2_9EURY|nr:DUF3267 domain-containing protein [Halogeometricum limi]SFR54351.1 Putative zincin peptidase [Halogeometricum limi]